MSASTNGGAELEEELKDYLNVKNINGILVQLVEDMLITKPENAIEFIVKYFMEKYPKETENVKKDVLPLNVVEIKHTDEKGDEDDDDEISATSSSDLESVELPIRRTSRRSTLRRASVFSESLSLENSEYMIKNIPKTEEEASRICETLSKNILFSHLDVTQMREVQNAMFSVEKKEGDVIIQQGDDGDNFYVIDEGFVEVFKSEENISENGNNENNETTTEEPKNQLVASYEPGDFFGELAIMYNAPRAATCIAKSAVKLWALDRISFKLVLIKTTTSKRNLHKEFLQQIPILSKLSEYEILTVADSLDEEKFEDGDVICRQGDKGDKFYIIKKGTAVCTRADSPGEERDVAMLTNGSYFGEIALVTTKPRQATVTAFGTLICLSMCRRAFKRVLGPIQDILMRNMEEYNKFQATMS